MLVLLAVAVIAMPCLAAADAELADRQLAQFRQRVDRLGTSSSEATPRSPLTSSTIIGTYRQIVVARQHLGPLTPTQQAQWQALEQDALAQVRGELRKLAASAPDGAALNAQLIQQIRSPGMSAGLLRIFIEEHADVRHVDARTGHSVVHVLATTRSWPDDGDPLAILLAAGADIDARDRQDATPLLLAARSGLSEQAAELLRHGAEPDARDHEGRTALHYAAHFANGPLATKLIAAGADTDLPANDDDTALSVAAKRNHWSLVRLLLDHGANPHVPSGLHVDGTPAGITRGMAGDSVALHILRHPALALTDALRRNAARRTSPRSSGTRGCGVLRATLEVDPASVAALLELGDNPDCVDKESGPPLTEAIQRMLIDWPSDDFGPWPAAYQSLRAERVRRVRLLIDTLLAHGADPTVSAQNGRAPLVAAAYAGDQYAIARLLEAGADLADSKGGAVLAIIEASKRKHWGTVRRLIDHVGRLARGPGLRATPSGSAAAPADDDPPVNLLPAVGALSDAWSQARHAERAALSAPRVKPARPESSIDLAAPPLTSAVQAELAARLVALEDLTLSTFETLCRAFAGIANRRGWAIPLPLQLADERHTADDVQAVLRYLLERMPLPQTVDLDRPANADIMRRLYFSTGLDEATRAAAARIPVHAASKGPWAMELAIALDSEIHLKGVDPLAAARALIERLPPEATVGIEDQARERIAISAQAAPSSPRSLPPAATRPPLRSAWASGRRIDDSNTTGPPLAPALERRIDDSNLAPAAKLRLKESLRAFPPELREQAAARMIEGN
ncbi:MAG: ankyrin repeat domain-containing protein [Gammaproteobacteria bacterium]